MCVVIIMADPVYSPGLLNHWKKFRFSKFLSGPGLGKMAGFSQAPVDL